MNFKTLNLEGAHRKRPFQLSGGMGQRVAFAAALAGGAPVLLADEPTKGLDENRKETVVDVLKQVPNRQGALVVITHDVSVAKSIGGNILVLKDGVLVESGDTLSVLNSPRHEYTNQLIQADPSRWQAVTVTRSDRPVLELNRLVAGRNGVAMTNPLDLSITEGRRVAITGPSGKGKSTLLDTLANLIDPISGSIDRQASLRPTDIQKIYQDPPAAFAPSVTLKNSLNDVAKLHNVSWGAVDEYLSRLGINLGLLERRPNAVSGGELQRVAIARALIVRPKLILADEPTSRLDPVTQRQTLDLLAEVAIENNTAVLLVTHDSALAQNWTEEIICL
jgi:peptide/nickel transport system ATP-binding protein